jgi:spoIIIJ-associated protein
MEWVTTTGRTVEEAQESALEQLGVLADDAEFEVLEEPRSGLFGRMRGEAKVRARVRPTPIRAKAERKDRKRRPADGEEQVRDAAPRPGGRPKKGKAVTNTPESSPESEPVDTQAPVASSEARPPRRSESGDRGRGGRDRGERVERGERPPKVDVDPKIVGDEAVKFLEGLLDAFDLDGEIEVQQDGDDLEVLVTGDDLGLLIGPKGNTLLAVQDLVRVASQRRLGDHTTHLRVDVGGYRARRREALSRFTVQQAEQVKQTGRARILEPMPSADRKVIHDTVATIAGISSRSEGDDPNRRVVITPAEHA